MMDAPKPAPSCVMVIFGANGDLTKRLVVPALYNLSRMGLLPRDFTLLGVDHNQRTADQWRSALHDFLEKTARQGGGEFEASSIDESHWGRVAGAMSYLVGDFTDAATYSHLAEKLNAAGNVLFYLAVSERFFGEIAGRLGACGLLKEAGGWRRVVVEKPFGHDLASAKALNARLLGQMRENQIYRIDHFLGKETVQNIMAFRFANGLFEPVWNCEHIDHVQITVAESIGVETRGKFYEATGALRDMVPNHLFQLLAMTAMEPPATLDADAVRGAKTKLVSAVRPLGKDDAVRGQYGPGAIGGKEVPGYRQAPNVAPDSNVETFVALKLTIANERWAGVPFYLRTGKCMPKRTSEIAICFKPAPCPLFRDHGQVSDDWLVLQIQPDEGIRLRFNAKRPGPAITLESVAMDFKYADWFKRTYTVGYETLIYDCMIGDPMLFQRADQIEAAWAAVQPVLDEWTTSAPDDFPNYAAGTAGPRCAEALLARDGRQWRALN